LVVVVVVVVVVFVVGVVGVENGGEPMFRLQTPVILDRIKLN